MRKIDDEIQMLLKEHHGNIRDILAENERLDVLYALSEQRELLLEWYDFDPQASLLQVGADYGAMTGLFRTRVAEVVVLDPDQAALDTVEQRCPGAANVRCHCGQLTRYAAQGAGEKRFDYVVFAGTLSAPYEAQIQAAKALLKPEGVLIVAAANPLGMKYLAGSRDEENGLTGPQLKTLLAGGQFYYPMPDYRTPVSIYSDRYLPKKGDLTRVTPAYDYPPYHMVDMGAKFDTVCEAGMFPQYANSYLVFWSENPAKIQGSVERVFIKYNKTRKDIFQIKTCICEQTGDDGSRQRFVEKAALSLAGSAHISSFQEKYEGLTRQHKTLKVAEPLLRDGVNAAYFPYLIGQTWAEKLGTQIQGGQLPVSALKEAMGQIYDMDDRFRSAFVRTEAFDEAFGAGLSEEELALLAQDTACQASNIDALFENMLLTQDGIYCLDYEWVFLFPVPERFVKYRILYYFYEQYSSVMKQMPFDQILAAFGITAELAEIYRKMEVNFQSFVHGENQQLYRG